MSTLRPFHLAFRVNDIPRTRRFYVDVLGCRVGREASRWIDFDFFGHQVTAHVSSQHDRRRRASTPVDGDQVPVPHFGIVLPMAEWEQLSERLRRAGVRFLLEPRVRFRGQPGEQATLFIQDPSGNALEFKAFPTDAGLFARD